MMLPVATIKSKPKMQNFLEETQNNFFGKKNIVK